MFGCNSPLLRDLSFQELEARVQQLTQESEELQNSRSKLAKDKVCINDITIVLVSFYFVTTFERNPSWHNDLMLLALDSRAGFETQ